MKQKAICYLKEGMSVWASQYIGQCGKRRGRNMVTIIKEKATCPKCIAKLKEVTLEKDSKG